MSVLQLLSRAAGLSALQLLIGLIVAPPLLLILTGTPVRETLIQLARGLRCFMSGFSTQICGDNRDAFGVRAAAL